jgi:hypothetical protein
VLGRHVERGRRFVEHSHEGALRDHAAGQGRELPLTTGKIRAGLAVVPN